MIEFFETIEKRESCRDFDINQPVEHEKLVACIEAARIAPSACNSQPWYYQVANNPEVCKKLRPALQGMQMNNFVETCPAFIVVSETYAGLMATVGGKAKKQHYALVDIGLAVSQLCLGATAQGLSTCILGWFNEDKIRELCQLPKTQRIRLVICVGYARKDLIRKKSRKAWEDIAVFLD